MALPRRLPMLLAAAAALGAAAAGAHASLERSEPADGEVVAAAPSRVEAWFVIELKDNGRNRLAVTGPDGERVDVGEPRVDPADASHLSTELREALPAGRYTVGWRASSEDGHPVEGEFAFRVDPSAGGDGIPAGGIAVGAAAVTALAGITAATLLRRSSRRAR